MPITQERMIALAAAGTDFEQAWQGAQDAIERQQARPDLSPETRAVLSELRFSVFAAATNPQGSAATLQLEREHFRRNASRNRYTAEKLEQRRRQAGIAPRRSTAPTFGLIAQKFKQGPRQAEDLPPQQNFVTLEALAIAQRDQGELDRRHAEWKEQQAKQPQPQPPLPPQPLQTKSVAASFEFHDEMTNEEALAADAALRDSEEEFGGVSAQDATEPQP